MTKTNDNVRIAWASINDESSRSLLKKRHNSITIDTYLKQILQQQQENNNSDEPIGDPVLCAIHGNDEPTLKLLIRAGHSINTISKATGRSLLHTAIYLGHINIVKRLLKEGANPSLKDGDGKGNLHIAAAYGYSRILTLLLKYENDLEQIDYDYNTPLHMATKFGHNECCRLLIYAGSRLNPINRDGDSPLHSAIRYKHAGCTLILINAGASLKIQNGRRETPVELATRLCHHKISNILLRALSLSSSSLLFSLTTSTSQLSSAPQSPMERGSANMGLETKSKENETPTLTINEFEKQWRELHLLLQTRMLSNQHVLEEQIDELKECVTKNQLKQQLIHRKLHTLTNLWAKKSFEQQQQQNSEPQQNPPSNEYDTLF